MKYCYRWMPRDRAEVDSALYDTREEAQAARDFHHAHGVLCSDVVEVSDDYEGDYGHREGAVHHEQREELR